MSARCAASPPWASRSSRAIGWYLTGSPSRSAKAAAYSADVLTSLTRRTVTPRNRAGSSMIVATVGPMSSMSTAGKQPSPIAFAQVLLERVLAVAVRHHQFAAGDLRDPGQRAVDDVVDAGRDRGVDDPLALDVLAVALRLPEIGHHEQRARLRQDGGADVGVIEITMHDPHSASTQPARGRALRLAGGGPDVPAPAGLKDPRHGAALGPGRPGDDHRGQPAHRASRCVSFDATASTCRLLGTTPCWSRFRLIARSRSSTSAGSMASAPFRRPLNSRPSDWSTKTPGGCSVARVAVMS